MNDFTVIGIDPGQAGAIVAMSADGKLKGVTLMPSTPKDVLNCLHGYAEADGVKICYLEDVGHGIPGQSSSATAKFARHNGNLEMALLALGIRTEKVTPQKWQKTYQLGRSGAHTKHEWKNKLKAKAQELFPGVEVTLGNADALLIAEYGRRMELGRNGIIS